MKKKIYILQHLGLGDYFNCNALIRFFYKKYSKEFEIHLFVTKKYFKTVRDIFSDLKKLKLKKIYENTSKLSHNQIVDLVKRKIKNRKFKLILVGYDYYTKNKKYINKKYTLDELFYKQFNIPYYYRFKNSYWKRNKSKENSLYKKIIKKKRFAFIHDDPSRGFIIDKNNIDSGLEVIKNNNKINILNYAKIIEKATEIHVMESSIRCMLESLNLTSKKNYLYNFFDGPWKSIPFYKKKKIIGSKVNWIIKDLNYTPDLKYRLKKFKNFILEFFK